MNWMKTRIPVFEPMRRMAFLFLSFLLFGGQASFLGAQVAARAQERAMVTLAAPDTGVDQEAVKRTHNALFDTYFPIEDLPLSPRLQQIAIAVRTQSWMSFQNACPKPEDTMGCQLKLLLEGFTYPRRMLPELPAAVQEYLVKHSSLAVQKFLRRGYAPLTPVERQGVLKALLESPFNDMRRVAATLRQVYSSVIYGDPLGNEIAGIKADVIFADHMEERVAAYKDKLPPSQLTYNGDEKTIVRKDGEAIDYLIVGSGPGGSVMAHELRDGKCEDSRGDERPCTVVLVDRGSFVVPGTTNTWSLPSLMYDNSNLSTADGGIFIRAGKALGGGSTVNADLAFSPLEATAHARIHSWRQKFLVDPRYYSIADLSDAYRWVRNTIGTRALDPQEINGSNQKLWDGAQRFGVDPSLYYLNRFKESEAFAMEFPPLIPKKSSVRMLLTNALIAEHNPLSVIPDAEVTQLLFEGLEEGHEDDVRVAGVRLTMGEPWTSAGNTVVDPSALGISPNTNDVVLRARNVILAAGSIGTTEILLKSREFEPALRNPLIGTGVVLHPAMPLIGTFCDPAQETCAEEDRVDLLEGLRESVHVDAFGTEPGFILECLSAFPSYGAVMIPGRGEPVFHHLERFNWLAGFGVLLIDTPSERNKIVLDPNTGNGKIEYSLSESDLKRLRQGVGIGIRIMFLAGAKQVIIPSNENFLELPDFDPTVGTYLTEIEQAAQVEHDLDFTPNRTILTSAHMQSSNKMGPTPDVGVVSWKHRVWNYSSGHEIPNLYIMDSSIFPTSVGANPMQSIYTFAKILSDRLNEGMD